MAPQNKKRLASRLIKNHVVRTRQDIADWIAAMAAAENPHFPNRTRLMELYNNVAQDAMLTSQLENRHEDIIGADIMLTDRQGKPNEDAATALRTAPFYESLFKEMLNTRWYGHSLIQFLKDDGEWSMELIPRTHVMPEKGHVKLAIYDQSGIDYRSAAEYGSTIFEFGGDLGMLTRAVPHILMKRLAQSCWSEFCETYGQPTKVLKTNTQDPEMMNRGETMLRNMGAAPYIIIDETELFEFVAAMDSDGRVYNNFIRLCDHQLSMLVSGAIIGQDTANGNFSKEESSKELTEKRINADKRMIEAGMSKLMPSLVKMGIVPDGITFSFSPSENKEALWGKVVDAMPHFDIDPEFISNKFGIPVKPKAANTSPF